MTWSDTHHSRTKSSSASARRDPQDHGQLRRWVGFERDECGCAYREEEEKRRGDQSLAWTKAHVTAENKAFLRTLKPEIRFEADGRRVLLVDGSPRRINEYLFEDRPLSSFQRLAASSNADIIVYGHTHKPYTKLVDGVFLNVG